MDEINFEKLFKKAKAFGQKQGLDPNEAEDFAQEAVIKSFEINGPVNLEYIFLNYRNFHRADKRVLSSPTGKLSQFRTVSIDAPIDNTDENSSKLSDLIGVSGDDVDGRDELRFIEKILQGIFKRIKSKDARKWAEKCYEEFLSELI